MVNYSNYNTVEYRDVMFPSRNKMPASNEQSSNNNPGGVITTKRILQQLSEDTIPLKPNMPLNIRIMLHKRSEQNIIFGSTVSKPLLHVVENYLI